MAMRDDGGQFGDILAQLKASQQGGSASLNDLNDEDKYRNDAINLSSGVVGSIQGPKLSALSKLAGNAVDESIPMAQRIQQAAANSAVKVVPTAEQAANDAVQAQFQGGPKNFFDNARAKAAQLGVGASPQEQAAMQMQKEATQNMIQNRNAQQMLQAKDPQFQNLRKMFGQ